MIWEDYIQLIFEKEFFYQVNYSKYLFYIAQKGMWRGYLDKFRDNFCLSYDEVQKWRVLGFQVDEIGYCESRGF